MHCSEQALLVEYMRRPQLAAGQTARALLTRLQQTVEMYEQLRHAVDESLMQVWSSTVCAMESSPSLCLTSPLPPQPSRPTAQRFTDSVGDALGALSTGAPAAAAPAEDAPGLPNPPTVAAPAEEAPGLPNPPTVAAPAEEQEALGLPNLPPIV